MEREDGDMELDSIDNGMTVNSVASRSISSAPSVAASDITSTSMTPSVAAPSIINHASAAPPTTSSALARAKGVKKRTAMSKPLENAAPANNTTPSIKPVPKGPSSASNAVGGISGIPELVAGADSGKDREGSNASRHEVHVDDENGRNGGGDDRGGHNGGGGNEGGGQDDEDNRNAASPIASPISGFHPMFELPPSPLLGLDYLPPSHFGSMEPEVTQAAPSSSLSSVPITAAAPKHLTVASSSLTVASSSPAPIAVTGPADESPADESSSTARKHNRPDENDPPEDVGPSTRAKKARISSSGAAASPPLVQDQAKKVAPSRKTTTMRKTPHSPPATTSDPSWLTSAISMLEAEDLGGCWSSLVQAWIAFERKESKQIPSILNSTHRPSVIRDWIQRAHSVSYRPAIESTLDFEKAYMNWWKELQPDWRLSSSRQIAYL